MTDHTVPDLSPEDDSYTDAPAVDEAMREAGWTWRYDYHRWMDPDGTTAIDYADGEIRLWRRTPAAIVWPDHCARYPCAPTQAVNVLVDIGVLPQEMHSLHAEVAKLTMLVGELSATVSKQRLRLDMALAEAQALSMRLALTEEQRDRYRERYERETGLAYDRADTEPAPVPVPVPDGVEGIAISGRSESR